MKKPSVPVMNSVGAASKPLNFLKEVQAELNKVVWPTREQTIRYSLLVVIVAVATGLFLGGLDYLLTVTSEFLIKSYGGS